MEWSCDSCSRKIISEKKGDFCLECEWKKQVEKIEITLETIRSFMEKHYFTYFKFGKEDGGNVINIGGSKEKILTFAPHKEKLSIDYYPKAQEEKHYWEAEYSEYSAFLEKLFQFAEKEKIKRIRGNYKIEVKSDFEKVLFKISDLIIEKKTAEEIEKEE